MGADLMRILEDVVQPTHVFELQPAIVDELYGFESGRKGDRVVLKEVPGMTPWGDDFLSLPPSGVRREPKVLDLPAAPTGPLASQYTAADTRALNLMSYFHFPSGSTSWRTEVPLLAIPPYEVDVNLAFDEIVFTGPGSEDVVPEEALRALNCSVVALVEVTEPTPTSTGPQGRVPGLPYTQGAAVPDPSTSRCLGLAFARGVSTAPPRLQLLTPIPPRELKKCRVLVKGEMEMPIWALVGSSSSEGRGDEWKAGTLHGTSWENVPYLTYREAGVVGSGVKRARKNVMRKGQT